VLRLGQNNGAFTAETSHQELVAAITGAAENSVSKRMARKQEEANA
jgi:D-xylose transport system ATP-binding protein